MKNSLIVLLICTIVFVPVLIPADGASDEITGGLTVSGTVEGIQTREVTSIIATGTITDAVAAATSDPTCADPNSIITLLERIYYETNIDIDKSLMIKGAGKEESIVDGGEDGTVFIIEPDNVVTMKEMTIRDGYNEIDDGLGGGIRNFGTLTLENVLITGNTAYRGSGIFNGGTLNLMGVSITDNIPSDSIISLGAGIYNDGMRRFNPADTIGIVNMYAGTTIS